MYKYIVHKVEEEDITGICNEFYNSIHPNPDKENALDYDLQLSITNEKKQDLTNYANLFNGEISSIDIIKIENNIESEPMTFIGYHTARGRREFYDMIDTINIDFIKN